MHNASSFEIETSQFSDSKFSSYKIDSAVKTYVLSTLSESHDMTGYQQVSKDLFCSLCCINYRNNVGDYFACNSFLVDGNTCHFGQLDISTIQNFTIFDSYDIYFHLDVDF